MGRVLVHGFTLLTAPAPSTHGRSALGASEVGLRVTLASVPDWLLSDTANTALQKGEGRGLCCDRLARFRFRGCQGVANLYV